MYIYIYIYTFALVLLLRCIAFAFALAFAFAFAFVFAFAFAVAFALLLFLVLLGFAFVLPSYTHIHACFCICSPVVLENVKGLYRTTRHGARLYNTCHTERFYETVQHICGTRASPPHPASRSSVNLLFSTVSVGIVGEGM